MCFVSVMTSQPALQQLQPVNQWPYQQALEFHEILRRLDALDKKLDLRDCHDEAKATFLKALADRIGELEAEMAK